MKINPTILKSRSHNIINSGSCLTQWQKEAVVDLGENFEMNFTLSEDGILTISGNTGLYSIPAPDAQPYYDEPMGPPCGWSEYVSQFKDMDFHTVIIEPGVRLLGKECFKDCKNFSQIILPEEMPVIRKDFADGTPLEYTEKEGLLFLGPASNPLYFLMGSKATFDQDKLLIPEGTVFIANEAFEGKKCIREVVFPSSLEFVGWYTFDGTSIKNVFIPEGKLAYDETLLAFDGKNIHLESISLPFSMYEEYRESNDLGLLEAWNRTAKIIFRNPDNSIAEVIQPHPLDRGERSIIDMPIDNNIKDTDELPF